MYQNDYEKETIINYNEGDPWATVYTCNRRLKERLKEISAEFPQECRYVKSYPPGAECYEVRKNLVNIRRPRSVAFREKMKQYALRSNARPPTDPAGS